MKSVFYVYFLLTTVTCRQGFGPTEQEWGFVTVRKSAHIFWWLHYTTADVDDYTEKPLVIWLQGGPGSSSTGYGNFAEIGPLDTDLNPRNTTWLKDVNLLFVDNPVGAGFSYVDTFDALTTTNRQIAEDFLVFLTEFYQILPEFRETPLYIFTESYGGKMTVEIALTVNQAISDGILALNLTGIGLGDSWISPTDTLLTWAPYLLSLGIVDQSGYEQIQESASLAKAALDNEEYTAATEAFFHTQTVVWLVTENVDLYNVLTKVPSRFETQHKMIGVREDENIKVLDIMNNHVRQALNITQEWGGQSGIVLRYLYEDFMKPVTDIVETLLNTTDIKIAVYNGQLDLIVDVLGTNQWINKLRFDGMNDWKEASRIPIVVNNYVEGYVKKSEQFAMYWIDRAGHMVPSDNPTAMNFILQDMIDGF